MAVEAESYGSPRGRPSFEAFYAAAYPQLVRAVSLTAGDPLVAEDAVQEALVRAYERWERVCVMEAPAAYVYQIAVNLLRRRWRRLRPLRPTAGADPSHRVAAEPMRGDLVAAIRALPEGQRRALILVDVFDLPSDAVARTLGIEAASVRSRVHRARARVRADLEQHDAEPR